MKFWLFTSNRPKHMLAGLIIHIVELIIGALLFWAFNLITLPNIWCLNILSLYTVLVAMLSVEYILKLIGGKFDLLDILAGIIPSILITLSVFLI